MGKRHRQPPRRRRPLPASTRREAAFWATFAVSLVAAAALYEAIGYRAEHVDQQYVSRYVPAGAVAVSKPPPTTTLPTTTLSTTTLPKTASTSANRPLLQPAQADLAR